MTWFRLWFDSHHYHKLYAHRDEAEAARFVDELVRRLRPTPGSAMLDLGCGAGRHARRLASKGFAVTGLDLAAASIGEARRFEGQNLRYFQHDMRVPFGRSRYDSVFNFFTSFGYFESEDEHLGVVRNVSDSLRAGGRFVLDYLNVRHAEATAVAHQVKTVGGHTYHLTRWSDDRHFFKRIVVDDGPAAAPVEHVERVAKLAREDFERLFALNGLRIEEAYGDYALSPYDRNASPRMIIVARKLDEAGEGGLRLPQAS